MSQEFDLPPAPAADQAGLLDDKDIRVTLTRMAWCQDRRDWAALDQVLDDSVEADYSSAGTGSVVLPRADLVANWRGGLAGTVSQHVLTGIDVDVDGDTAHATLNETAWIQRRDGDRAGLLNFGTFMDCRLRRTPAGWRIAALRVVPIWDNGAFGVIDWSAPSQ
jgi:hypothetical protein